MKTDGSTKPASPAPTPAPGENTIGSGEGASTALDALIRKRKQVETPDNDPPAPPAVQ
jgi:hypothetical protein